MGTQTTPLDSPPPKLPDQVCGKIRGKYHSIRTETLGSGRTAFSNNLLKFTAGNDTPPPAPLLRP